MHKDKSFLINGNYLYLDKNIVTVDIPLLFTCIDDYKQRYLVLCIDSEELKYLIAKTTTADLIDMLNSTIDLREPFKKSKELWTIISGFNLNDDVVERVSYKDIPENDLPRKAAFLDFTNQTIESYMSELENEIGIHCEKFLDQKNKYIFVRFFKILSYNNLSKKSIYEFDSSMHTKPITTIEVTKNTHI